MNTICTKGRVLEYALPKLPEQVKRTFCNWDDKQFIELMNNHGVTCNRFDSKRFIIYGIQIKDYRLNF